MSMMMVMMINTEFQRISVHQSVVLAPPRSRLGAPPGEH